jgi:hypothetical protein
MPPRAAGSGVRGGSLRYPPHHGEPLHRAHLIADPGRGPDYGLGWVADHAGVLAALALLAAQPVGLVALAAVTSPRRAVTTADRDSRDSRTGDAP